MIVAACCTDSCLFFFLLFLFNLLRSIGSGVKSHVMVLASMPKISESSQVHRPSGREVASWVVESQKLTQKVKGLTQARDGIVESGVDAEA